MICCCNSTGNLKNVAGPFDQSLDVCLRLLLLLVRSVLSSIESALRFVGRVLDVVTRCEGVLLLGAASAAARVGYSGSQLPKLAASRFRENSIGCSSSL